jgi:hypothetical protein
MYARIWQSGSLNGSKGIFMPVFHREWELKRQECYLYIFKREWEVETALHKENFKYQSWYLTPYCGLEVQKRTQALKSVKCPGNTFNLNSNWSRTLPSLIYFSWDIYKEPPSIKKFKYQCWYLTLCCGLEVQKSTKALKSVKGPGNTFDWNPKWSRTLPSLIYFSWDIYREPPSIKKISNIKVDIWHPTVGLRCIIPPRHLSQLKVQVIPLT